MTYDQVMAQANAASTSGNNATIASAMDAIDQYFNAHAPNANNGDNGDMTDEQIAQMGDARVALQEGRHVTYVSPLLAGFAAGGSTLIDQEVLLATGNVGAAVKNAMKAGQDFVKQSDPKSGLDTKGFDWDVVAAWSKAHKWEIVAVGGLLALLATASLARSVRDILP
jgi:hypothetical protein